MLATGSLEQIITVGEKRFLLCLKKKENAETLEALHELTKIYATSENIWREIQITSNWGGGWEWEERFHPKSKMFHLTDAYRSSASYGSAVAPYEASQRLGVTIKGEGLHIQQRQKNRPPYDVGYLFECVDDTPHIDR